VFALLLVVPAAARGDGGGFVRGFLRASVLVFVGRISYGLFLWHWVIVITARNQWVGGGATASTFAVGALAIGPSLLAAAASWYLIERPCMRLAQRITRR
jgi:peptidoglycan/LPS O-acetylase OafA/YrhL